MKTLMLNGKEVLMDNFGADTKTDGFNRYGVFLPAYAELPKSAHIMLNALSIDAAGYEHALTVLTQIKARAVTQKFYTLNPSEFMPVVVGEGALMDNLVFNSVYELADDFETGYSDTSDAFDNKPGVDVKIIAKPIPIQTWRKGMKYSMIEVQKAAKGNLDIISAKETARKRNWDLGIQRTAFLGSKSRADVLGMLTAESVNVNTNFIGKPISSMDADEFAAFVAGILPLWSKNCNSTVLPDTFMMPLYDNLAMSSPVSNTFPIVDKMTYLENAFKRVCGPNFKVVATLYGNRSQMTTAGVSHHRYCLYRNDSECGELNIPLAYTSLSFGTADGMNFQNVAYGQFTGFFAKRPQEFLYFDDVNTASD
jgi:hypothetical protein